jgi:lysophospholipase L1-like esterase
MPGIGNDENQSLVLDYERSFINQTGGNVALETELRTRPGRDYSTGLFDVAVELVAGPAVGDDVVNLTWLSVPPPFGDEISSYTIYTRDEVTSLGVWSPFKTIPGDQNSLTISSNERRVGRYYLVETTLASGSTEYTYRMAAGPARYVALGDSFSAGEGLPEFEPGTDTDTNSCHRSYGAYSRLLVATGIAPDPAAFHACSGARVIDLESPNAGSENEPPQIEQLSEFTDVVTMTIGGNDIGFKNVVIACVVLACDAALIFDGLREELRQRVPEVDQFIQELVPCSASDVITALLPQAGDIAAAYDAATFQPDFEAALELLCESLKLMSANASTKQLGGELEANLTDALVALHDRAPNASTYVMGYPRLFPESIAPNAYCESNGFLKGFGFVESEMLFANKLVGALNSEVRSAVDNMKGSAAGTGPFRYVDAYDAFEGHELCTGDPASNMLTAPVYDLEYSYHPNALGHQLLAGVMGKALESWTRVVVAAGATEVAKFTVPAGSTVAGVSILADFPEVDLVVISPERHPLPAGCRTFRVPVRGTITRPRSVTLGRFTCRRVRPRAWGLDNRSDRWPGGAVPGAG